MLKNRARKILFALIAAAMLAAVGAYASRPPSWEWVSEVLPGDYAENEGTLRWSGLWPDQTLSFPEIERHWRFWPLFWGKRAARIETSVGSLDIARPLWGNGGALGLLEAVFAARNTLGVPLPLLRQVDAKGKIRFEARAVATKYGFLDWDGTLQAEDAVFSFGPAERQGPSGVLRLHALAASWQVRGAELRFTRLEGQGDGITVRGEGILGFRGEPTETLLRLSFDFERTADSPEPRVPGWEQALAEESSFDVLVEGTVGKPDFLVNGFRLVEESLLPEENLPEHARRDLTDRLATSAAIATQYEPAEPFVSEADSWSPSDIEKLQAQLRAAPSNRKKYPGAVRFTEWGKRRRQLKKAYKKQIKKLEKEGHNLGRKAVRNVAMPAVDEQLEKEFGRPPTPEEAEEARVKSVEQEKASKEAP